MSKGCISKNVFDFDVSGQWISENRRFLVVWPHKTCDLDYLRVSNSAFSDPDFGQCWWPRRQPTGSRLEKPSWEAVLAADLITAVPKSTKNRQKMLLWPSGRVTELEKQCYASNTPGQQRLALSLHTAKHIAEVHGSPWSAPDPVHSRVLGPAPSTPAEESKGHQEHFPIT